MAIHIFENNNIYKMLHILPIILTPQKD